MQRFMILLLLAAAASLIPAAAPATAAPLAAPSGWVQAQVVGGGCDSAGHCSSTVKPGSPTLYEYKPDRQSVGRDFAVGADRSQHGGYPTYVSRDKCHIGSIDYYWSAGIWHHGGYWTLTFDAAGSEHWSGPTNQHWAFEHNDTCVALPTPIPTATAAPPPPGAPTYTPLPPTAIPTATPAPVCSASYGAFDQRGNLKIVVPGVPAQEYAYDAQLPNGQGQLFPISYLYQPSLTNLPPYGLGQQRVPPSVPLTIAFRFDVLESMPADNDSYDVNHPGQAHVIFGLRDDTTGQLLLGTDTTDRKELKNSNGEVKLWDRTLQLNTTTVASGLTFGGTPVFSRWDKYHSPYWVETNTVPAPNWYLRHFYGPWTVTFTPQAEHTYTVFTWNGHGHCKVEAPRWTIAQFVATTRPYQTPTPSLPTATPRPTYTPTPLPPAPPVPAANFNISIHSTLDPNSADSNPSNAVYKSTGNTISWPAGEVLDFTPRVQISVTQPIYSGYRVQAHVQDWSYVSSLSQRAATTKDALGRTGCRGSGRLTSGASGAVCTYAYIGGTSLTDSKQPTDADMTTQAHIYWAPSVPQSMRSDVYTYALGQLQAADLTVEVRIVVEVVNVATGSVVGSRTDTATSTFGVSLVVPRSAK
jgi:hypothetical protein